MGQLLRAIYYVGRAREKGAGSLHWGMSWFYIFLRGENSLTCRRQTTLHSTLDFPSSPDGKKYSSLRFLSDTEEPTDTLGVETGRPASPKLVIFRSIVTTTFVGRVTLAQKKFTTGQVPSVRGGGSTANS